MKHIIFLSVLLFTLCSCGEDSMSPQTAGTPPAGGELSFSQNILPIFNANRCSGCHGGTSGLTVTTVAALLRGGDHGPAIVPFHADSSLLAKKISPTPPFGARMPLGGPYLSDSTISEIRRWIDEGAKDN
jgi:cytochrome c